MPSDSQSPKSTPPKETSSSAHTLARSLLEIGAVELRPEDPFTWSSGLVAPIYCDNRLTLSHPRVRRRICEGFYSVGMETSLAESTIAGTATAGIPHAAWLADRVDAPMAYVRDAPKGHGQGSRIEGVVQQGDQVVLIEDLISTGGSALSAVQALRDHGASVPAVLAIFTYELDTAVSAFETAEVPLHTLTSFSTLLEVARERQNLGPDALSTLREWRADPVDWSQTRGGVGSDAL